MSFSLYSFRYVPAAVEISRTASSGGTPNVVSHDHHNHNSKIGGENSNPVISFGVAPNDGNRNLGGNFSYHEFMEPCIGSAAGGKPAQQQNRQQLHPNYATGFESANLTLRPNKNILQK